MMTTLPSLEISALKKAYINSEFTPAELIQTIIQHAKDLADYNIWIYLLNEQELAPFIKNLENKTPEELPLYGVPFAIKDNIDLAGFPTTAACEQFSYTPEKSATVVELLINAGAIPIGKTNMDQFATGLVGTRSPEKWGVCKNAFNQEYISGGSSSGSAVAVAKGLVSFSLGTDTAGSGRVPASFNNLIGLKASKGLLSTTGVVPACRSLDCVSIFSLTALDANTVFSVAAKEDASDCYSRAYHFANQQKSFGELAGNQLPRVGILAEDQIETFGDEQCKQLYLQFIENLNSQGFKTITIDFAPFKEAALLLYDGPWVAERFAAVGDQLDNMLEVTAAIIGGGGDKTAQEAFAAQYKLQAFKKRCDKVWQDVDVILTPTTPGHYRIEDVLANPIQLNSQLGAYTNFMNLLDYSAIAVPTSFRQNGLPNGVTFFAPAFDDLLLLSIANKIQQQNNFTLGATKFSAELHQLAPAQSGFITVAVCGAHLEGLPLNWQLTQRNSRLLEKTKTAKKYRFYALAGGPPFRPGLIRVTDGSGASIDVELWKVPASDFGSFVAGIPDPLGIGKLELEDGRWVSSFICEAYGVEGATDITAFGNWRDFMANH